MDDTGVNLLAPFSSMDHASYMAFDEYSTSSSRQVVNALLIHRLEVIS
jgi:hypothetical protein